MIVTALTTIERWFLETCEFSPNSLARLYKNVKGQASLYESYQEFCFRERIDPVGIKQFARTVFMPTNVGCTVL